MIMWMATCNNMPSILVLAIRHAIYRLPKVFLAIFSILFGSYSSAQTNQYSFGVFPYIPLEKMEQLWSPLTAHISQQLNKPIMLRTRSSFSTYENALSNEVFDIAFMQPFDYVNIASKHGYIPIARLVGITDKDHKGEHKAIVVVLKENKNLKLADLKGKTIATPPASAAVTLLGKDLLRKNSLIAGKDYKIVNHINHHSCLRQLIINKPIACITAYPAFARFNPITNNRLAIIAYSKAIPSSLIAVHKRVAENDRKIIKKTLLNLNNFNTTKTFLEKAQLADFISANDEDYDSVRMMWKRINTP